jgi:ElaB/YqjD/DUF883 family membrane-anchored ribosome-binding protein
MDWLKRMFKKYWNLMLNQTTIDEQVVDKYNEVKDKVEDVIEEVQDRVEAVKEVVEQAEDVVEAATAKKQRRGRPKGSKNQK